MSTNLNVDGSLPANVRGNQSVKRQYQNDMRPICKKLKLHNPESVGKAYLSSEVQADLSMSFNQKSHKLEKKSDGLSLLRATAPALNSKSFNMSSSASASRYEGAMRPKSSSNRGS